MFATRTYDISASVESSVRVHSEIFWQNLKNSLVAKRTIHGKVFESPSGFIGCIWRLCDRVSAAPAILNMRPRQCVTGVTV